MFILLFTSVQPLQPEDDALDLLREELKEAQLKIVDLTKKNNVKCFPKRIHLCTDT